MPKFSVGKLVYHNGDLYKVVSVNGMALHSNESGEEATKVQEYTIKKFGGDEVKKVPEFELSTNVSGGRRRHRRHRKTQRKTHRKTHRRHRKTHRRHRK